MGEARELKFRVWDEDYKKMVYPIGIDWGTDKRGIIYRYWTNNKKNIGEKIGMPVHKELSVLMQFTGLQDKNGVDIFEGDILEFKNDLGRRHLHKVFRAEGGLVINSHDSDVHLQRVVFYNACADMQTAGWIKQCAVIGNIHENPELLNN